MIVKKLEQTVMGRDFSAQHLIKLTKKKLRKEHHALPVLDEYIFVGNELKYVAIFRNGSQRVVSNAICQGIYDNDFKPEMIIEMFKKRVTTGYL